MVRRAGNVDYSIKEGIMQALQKLNQEELLEGFERFSIVGKAFLGSYSNKLLNAQGLDEKLETSEDSLVFLKKMREMFDYFSKKILSKEEVNKLSAYYKLIDRDLNEIEQLRVEITRLHTSSLLGDISAERRVQELADRLSKKLSDFALKHKGFFEYIDRKTEMNEEEQNLTVMENVLKITELSKEWEKASSERKQKIEREQLNHLFNILNKIYMEKPSGDYIYDNLQNNEKLLSYAENHYTHLNKEFDYLSKEWEEIKKLYRNAENDPIVSERLQNKILDITSKAVASYERIEEIEAAIKTEMNKNQNQSKQKNNHQPGF